MTGLCFTQMNLWISVPSGRLCWIKTTPALIFQIWSCTQNRCGTRSGRHSLILTNNGRWTVYTAWWTSNHSNRNIRLGDTLWAVRYQTRVQTFIRYEDTRSCGFPAGMQIYKKVPIIHDFESDQSVDTFRAVATCNAGGPQATNRIDWQASVVQRSWWMIVLEL